MECRRLRLQSLWILPHRPPTSFQSIQISHTGGSLFLVLTALRVSGLSWFVAMPSASRSSPLVRILARSRGRLSRRLSSQRGRGMTAKERVVASVLFQLPRSPRERTLEVSILQDSRVVTLSGAKGRSSSRTLRFQRQPSLPCVLGGGGTGFQGHLDFTT